MQKICNFAHKIEQKDIKNKKISIILNIEQHVEMGGA